MEGPMYKGRIQRPHFCSGEMGSFCFHGVELAWGKGGIGEQPLDALAQLLIEKGITTEQEFFAS
jgi:hypothetical protein